VVGGTNFSVTANSSNFEIGYGFNGCIDDVRYYHRDFSEKSVQTVYRLGYRPAEGMYHLRADNNSTIHFRIDGKTNNRRFPVFMVENYWGSALPATNCVTLNGTALTANTDYYARLNTTYRWLVIGLNKTITTDSALLYIDDKSSEGARCITPMKKMVWGKYSGTREWFWCKNFTGDYMGASGTNQFYAAWKMDSANDGGSQSHGGEVHRFKFSDVTPNVKADTSSDSNLVSSSVIYGGTPLGYFFPSWGATNIPSLLSKAIPSYSVIESSAVRVVLQLNEKSDTVSGAWRKIKTRWTIYPTGQVFRWDSIGGFSATPDWTAYGAFQNPRATSGHTIDTTRKKNRMRGGCYSNYIHDYATAFLGFNYTTGSESYPFRSDTMTAFTTADNYRAGIRFSGDTVAGCGIARWGATPIQMALYFDYQRDNLTDKSTTSQYCDSVSNGVQCLAFPSHSNVLGMKLGSIVTTSAGDLNQDGFNEREGAYMVQASNNAVLCTLLARNDTVRYNPVFHITNYLATQKPQYVFCYQTNPAEAGTDTMMLIEGYEYNMYHNKTAHELVVQIDSVFRDSTIIYISSDRTLAVQLSRFDAIGGDGCDTVKWRTESENENLGYYLYRRIKPAFLDSLAKTTDTLADDTALDGAGVLFKRKTIGIKDTGWALVNMRIIPSLGGGTSFGPLEYRHIDYRDVYNDVVYEYKLEAVDYHSEREEYGPSEARPVGKVPIRYALWGNYPNPLRKLTIIRYDLPAKTKVSINIYNLQGKLIRKLVKPDKALKRGYHRVTWDGLNDRGQPVASGPYIYHMITATKFVKSRVMVVLR
jgi:hypothetical protein